MGMTGNFLIQCKTRKMEVLQFLAVAFGSYVFGIIVMMIIRANTMEENECVTLGMLIAMAALVFVHFFGIIFSFVGEFNMAISMGATRRAYVGSYALFNMAPGMNWNRLRKRRLQGKSSMDISWK